MHKELYQIFDGTSQEPSPLHVSSKNIGSYRTAKLSNIIDDIMSLAPVANKESALAKILMARGVARSFLIRRKVLNYTKSLCRRMTTYYGMLAKGTVKRPSGKVPVEVRNYYKLLGKLEALGEISREIQEIGMTKGFQLPDNDSKFVKLLRTSFKPLRKL
jgi:hypothetical protein